MRRVPIPIAILTLAISVGAAAAAPAKPKPRATKPAVKPASPVKGTVQMAGDNGKVGTTYTVGKDAGAINFTLLRAEYVATPIRLSDQVVCPKADEKFLVLHFTAHNPNPREYLFYGGSLHYTAVDSENVNREGSGLVRKEDTTEPLSISLKPAQKVAGFTLIKMPAKASIPKLIVQHAGDQPVLRYNFAQTDIKPLAAPYADPADATGCTAVSQVPAEKETAYPLGLIEVTLTGVTVTTDPIGGLKPRPKEQLVVAAFTLKNNNPKPRLVYGGTFDTAVTTESGDKSRATEMFRGAEDERASNELEPGQEYKVRYIYRTSKDAPLAKLTISEGSTGRVFVFTGDALK